MGGESGRGPLFVVSDSKPLFWRCLKGGNASSLSIVHSALQEHLPIEGPQITMIALFHAGGP